MSAAVEMLGIGNHGFEIAEGDVCRSQVFCRVGESGIGIGPVDINVPHQHEFNCIFAHEFLLCYLATVSSLPALALNNQFFRGYDEEVFTFSFYLANPSYEMFCLLRAADRRQATDVISTASVGGDAVSVEDAPTKERFLGKPSK